jgi:NodT family efflux transporter outer membrane factor (OMF) lipoprotein
MHRLLPLALTISLAACTVGPDFAPPDPEAQVPAGFNDTARAPNAAVTMQAQPDPLWWTQFGDPVLNGLVKRTIAGNPGLQQAVLRIAQSRQNEAATRGAALPAISADTSYTRQQLGLRGILRDRGAFDAANNLRGNTQLEDLDPGLGNRAADAAGGLLNGISQPTNLYQAGFDASWELDLFGRIRRQVEQAGAQTQAVVEGGNDVLVSLLAEVAQTYAGLRGAQALAAAQQENIGAARELLRLNERRQRQGLGTQLDVENQRAQVTNFEAQLQPYTRQVQQAMNRLSVLTGEPPGTLDDALAAARPIPPAPPLLPVGLPSGLARRRPDIRRAEANLHAATAGVGVAVAQFYPAISLTGSLGLRGIEVSALSDWSNHFYSLGPTISIPVFQGGRLKANLRLAGARQKEAALAYRAAVLQGLQEVEDALVAYRTDQAQTDKLRQTVQSARTALGLSRNAYDNGLVSFIQVLDAQRVLVQARQQEVQARLSLTNDIIALYKALGGGWSDREWLRRAQAAQR